MEKKRLQSKKQLRNLAQYREMSDDDFETLWEERDNNTSSYADFEERIKKKIEEFSLDYDIDDLKINDREALRLLVQAIISLEDYEQMMYDLRSNSDINQSNVGVINNVNKVMSDLRKDVSKLQEDLNITRKIRKSDKESSVISYIANIKEQAKIFYESKASYIFCPECNMLLGTVWVLYPEADNKYSFTCKRPMPDGSLCEHKFTVTSKDLLKNRGTNKTEITPESML